MKVVIVRYGEIGLKGNNRGYFETKLINNIKDCLNKNNIKFNAIRRYSGRILISTDDKCLCLKNVFGMSSFSPSTQVELDLNKIRQEALNLYTRGNFRISAKRLNKRFPLSSEELNKDLGNFIMKNKKTKVSLVSPDCNIAVEIMDNAYLFNERYECLGGLPVGVEGLVTLILENKESLLAGILMLKRGCYLEIINEKNINFSILEKYSYGGRINIVKIPSKESKAIVKVDDLKNTRSKFYDIPVLNPLIANEKSLFENIKK